MIRTAMLLTCAALQSSQPILPINQQPFLFTRTQGDQTPLPVVSKPFVNAPIRLDDGSVGALSLTQELDSHLGVNPGEDFLLTLRDSKNIVLGQIRLLACYERFQLALADIVAGQGEEILFISQRFHGSSIYNPVLSILQLKKAGLVASGSIELGSSVGMNTIWIDQTTINLSAKPASFYLIRHWEPDSSNHSQFEASQITSRQFFWSASKDCYVQSVPSNAK